MRELTAVHRAGHDDVGEQKIERHAGIDHFERLGRIASGDDGVAETFEAAGDMHAHDVVILDAQNGFRSAAQFLIVSRRSIASSKRVGRLDVGFREIDAEAGALALLAVDDDGAAGLLGKSEHHAQSEPSAGAELLGRKERLENPVAYGRRNAGAAVDDLDGDVVARNEIADLRVVLIAGEISGPEQQPAAFGHRRRGR